MDEFPRRRRLQTQEPKKTGSGLPLLPLVVLVVLAGLLLGGLLAKVFGGGGGTSQAPSPIPSFTPLPSAGPTATFAPRATPRHASPKPSESASPSVAPSATAQASEQPSASAEPSTKPSVRPSVIYITPAPQSPTSAPKESSAPTVEPTAEPTQAATPVLITGGVTADHAAAIVRAYIGAVSRGEESTAAGYLAHGLPNESFLTSSSKITDVQASPNGNGSFVVTASISTASGSYYETFTVVAGPYGMQITDHSASPVH